MDISGKKILVLGAGRGNLGLVKTAKQKNVEVIVAGLGGNYPCAELADKNVYADIAKPEEILEAAIEEKVDGVIICCSDTGLKSVGKCNDTLHLSGITEESAIWASNKLMMKEILVSAGVRTARFRCITNYFELNNFIDETRFPVIIKAVDLQGSRGIYIVKEKELLKTAFDSVMKDTKQDFCIVEEYIEGTEFGSQAFVYNGDILFILPHGDEMIQCNTMVPIGHYMPYEISNELYQDVIEQSSRAIKALKLDNCAVNIDLIERNGKAYIIELTGRVGANCLPELTSNYYGLNYYEMILNVALGESPLPVWEQRQTNRATLSKMIFSERSGIVSKISLPEMADVQINMFARKGDSVRAFNNSNDAIGEIILKSDNLDMCRALMKTVINQIQIDYE